MKSKIPIILNHRGKEESDKLLDWLFEKQNANGFTYEFWYATEEDEEQMKVLERLLEPYKDSKDWGELEDYGFEGIVFLHQEKKPPLRYTLNKETLDLIKAWTHYGLVSQIEYSGFQNIKIFKGGTLLFSSENLHDVGYLWLTKAQLYEFQALHIPYEIEQNNDAGN